MDNPEKLATQGTQDEEKQNKNITQYMLHKTQSTDKQNKKTQRDMCWIPPYASKHK